MLSIRIFLSCLIFSKHGGAAVTFGYLTDKQICTTSSCLNAASESVPMKASYCSYCDVASASYLGPSLLSADGDAYNSLVASRKNPNGRGRLTTKSSSGATLELRLDSNAAFYCTGNGFVKWSQGMGWNSPNIDGYQMVLKNDGGWLLRDYESSRNFYEAFPTAQGVGPYCGVLSKLNEFKVLDKYCRTVWTTGIFNNK